MTAIRLATHVHSTWSYDGHWALEDLARAFAKRGYHAVLTAEHDRTFDPARWRAYRAACTAASAHGATLVPGIEYSDAANRVHVPVWGADEFLGADRPTAALLADARAAGATAIIAHPARRDAWQSLSDETLALADGIEIWNRKYDGWAPSPAAVALAGHHGLAPFVGLDFHTARQFFPLALAGTVAAEPEAIYAALRTGVLAPQAFTMPAARFAAGPGHGAARAAEVVRRRLAKALRQGRRLASRTRAS